MEPTKMGEFTIAVFDDTCGNLIQIMQKNFMTKYSSSNDFIDMFLVG